MQLRTVASSGPAYDPTLTPTNTDIIGGMTAYKINEIKGPIQNGDKKVLIAALSTPIVNASAKLIDNGQEYEIINVELIAPGEVSILHKVQIRR